MRVAIYEWHKGRLVAEVDIPEDGLRLFLVPEGAEAPVEVSGRTEAEERGLRFVTLMDVGTRSGRGE